MRTTHVTAHDRTSPISYTAAHKQEIERKQQDLLLNQIIQWENQQLDKAQEAFLMNEISKQPHPEQYGKTVTDRIQELKSQGIIKKHNTLPNLSRADKAPDKLNIRATSNKSIINKYLTKPTNTKTRHLSIQNGNLYSYNHPIGTPYHTSVTEHILLINNHATTKTSKVHTNLLLKAAIKTNTPHIQITFPTETTLPQPPEFAHQQSINQEKIAALENQILKSRKATKKADYQESIKQLQQQNTHIQTILNPNKT